MNDLENQSAGPTARAVASGDGFAMVEPMCTILPILVLYNSTLADSSTYCTFVAASRSANLDPTSIAVYDNSPARQVTPAQEADLLAYRHDSANGGIAAAYNWALDIAIQRSASWLMLLDQDSTLPPEFLRLSLSQVCRYDANTAVVAIVPVVRSRGARVSPMRVGPFGLRQLPADTSGIQTKEIMAINSGAVIRCNFLESIGGFNRAYWLDYLDHWLFHQVYSSGKKAAVSDCILKHRLSVQGYRKGVSIERYRSIIAGEAGFITAYKSKSEVSIYLLRLLARSVKMTVKLRTDIAGLTIATIFNIIMHPTGYLEGNHK
jgi:hypothetical protein